MTVLADVGSDRVVGDPYPHLVIQSAVPADKLAQLAAEMPDPRALAGRSWWGSNRRGNAVAAEILDNPDFPACWREFIASHTGQPFLEQAINVLRPSILARYPDFERTHGDLDALRAGIRGVDSFDNADVLLDAIIGFNTPVRGKPSRVRGAHLDRPDKLFVGLLYLRDPADDSTGGDLELYAAPTAAVGLDHRLNLHEAELERRVRVPYERNTLVMFLNSPEAFHGVSARQPTPHPRLFVNFAAEVRRPLFEPTARAASPLQRVRGAVSRRLWQSTE